MIYSLKYALDTVRWADLPLKFGLILFYSIKP